MPGPYANLTDAQLTAKLQSYEDANDEAALTGGLKSIAGEGRRKEFVGSNPTLLAANLRELRAESARRGLGGVGPRPMGGSLEIIFGREPAIDGVGYGVGPFVTIVDQGDTGAESDGE